MRLSGRLLKGLSILFAALLVLLAILTVFLPVSPALAGHAVPFKEAASLISDGQTIKVITKPAASVTKSSAVLAGFLESLGPYVDVMVWFELATGQMTAPKKMIAPGPFSATVSALTSYSSYQFRAIAASPLSGGQKVLGDFLPFHTLVDKPVAPIAVTTSAVTDITSSTVVLHGFLSGMETYNAVRVWFNWGASAGFGNTAGEQILYAPGPFSIKITGLNPKIQYYFRAGAVPAVGGIATVYSATDSFITPVSELIVKTVSGTDITHNSVTLTGNLESMGDYTEINVWFEWGKTPNYERSTQAQPMYKTGVYTWTLKNLEPGITYYFRALAVPATTGWITVRGIDRQFTTLVLPGMDISTREARNITSNSAVLDGWADSFGISSSVSAWFEYGTDTNYGLKTLAIVVNSPGNFSSDISGLSSSTTYYFRALVNSGGRTAISPYRTFSTAPSTDFLVATGEAWPISSTSASLNAQLSSVGISKPIKVWFDYGLGPECAISTPDQTMSVTGPVSAQVSGLNADSKHYFKVVAQSPSGSREYGKISTFKTLAMPKISVSTYPATGITGATAILNGSLDNLGNESFIQAWFEYGTTPELGNTTIRQTLKSVGQFNSTILINNGLTYYYRALATNTATGETPVSGALASFSTAVMPKTPAVAPNSTPYEWFIYLKDYISIEAAKILKSLNILNFGSTSSQDNATLPTK